MDSQIIKTPRDIAMIMFDGNKLRIKLLKNKHWVNAEPEDIKDVQNELSNIVKFMPSAKSTLDIFTPFTDFTNQTPFTGGGGIGTMGNDFSNQHQPHQQHQINRMMESGKTGTKRCVSETKKKFVASQQSWNCGHCQKQLPAWFEVDHKIRLDQGGSNHVDNLVALCRDCHGKKTAMENL